jgi:hypothetical protein
MAVEASPPVSGESFKTELIGLLIVTIFASAGPENDRQ